MAGIGRSSHFGGAVPIHAERSGYSHPPWSDAPNAFWVHTYGVTDAQVGTVAGGYADGTFRPYRAVTRAEFAKMAVSGLGIAAKDPVSPTFIDVLPDTSFYVHVEGAYAAGLLEGVTTPAGKVFAPDSDITRQQANSILGRYLSGKELEVTGVITGVTGGETGGATYPSLRAWYAAQGFDYLSRFADYQDVLPAHAPGTSLENAYPVYTYTGSWGHDRWRRGCLS
jgi:hypothetical protein